MTNAIKDIKHKTRPIEQCCQDRYLD